MLALSIGSWAKLRLLAEADDDWSIVHRDVNMKWIVVVAESGVVEQSMFLSTPDGVLPPERLGESSPVQYGRLGDRRKAADI